MSQAIRYSFEDIQQEARQLVYKGIIKPQQSLDSFLGNIPQQERLYVEYELEQEDFKLGDRIEELVGSQRWNDD